MYKEVHKPWGKEEWLELNEAYCYKRIYINAGYKTSYQYHEFKKETNYIIDGIAEVWLENNEGIVEKKIMKAGEFFNVTPPKKHRVIAITDIILQEVSTPHVDDVFRIDDEFNRADGKIEAEHKTPAVLILTAGIGSRLKDLTKNINKAMLPINNKAIISYIIDKFPKDYEFVIALGYKGDSLKEYCKIAYPNYKFTFVNINNFTGEKSGPGYSTLQCKEHLQRPFYFIVADCIIDSPLPHLDGNWLGVQQTAYPEKYSTVKLDNKDNILDVKNIDVEGYDNAFIGLASIWDYDIFWNELESNIKNGEVVSAFENPSKYPSFKAKQLKWLDTGNLDDLNKTKEHFNDTPLSLYKITDEITYKRHKFIKFNPDTEFIKNKSKRAEILNKLIPSGFSNTEHFISYEWEPGITLYECDSFSLYNSFLFFFENILKTSNQYKGNKELFDAFYITKTEQRKQKFLDRFGVKYLNEKYTINRIEYSSLEEILSNINLESLYTNPLYDLFHGDLQFDNIIYDSEINKYTYIDWRESFGGDTKGGDVYYDLAKLYGGCIIPYNLMKEEGSVKLYEGSSVVSYSYRVPTNLTKFKEEYEKWIINQGFDLNKIKFITAIIFLNMSPLHDEKFGKMLWFKSIEILTNVNK
jgi:NDP-sugar pyrophosphorylase family protein/mannose-6-phosphate isomerase-like protein (cupin superfamily)